MNLSSCEFFLLIQLKRYCNGTFFFDNLLQESEQLCITLYCLKSTAQLLPLLTFVGKKFL